ncbi:MAG: PIN domain nuclease [Chthonomonadales bacterium]|nr:PIN domain nuclease [Chthonomonadales bacterium]
MQRGRRRRPRYHWDTCCFIALMNREDTTDEIVLLALRQTFHDMLFGEVEVTTSAMLISELLIPDPDKATLERQLEACPYFDMVDTHQAVHRLAADIRKHCRDQGVAVPKTPDAIHIASAILARVDEMWTTDKGLIGLAERGVITEVPIVRPHVTQLKLDLWDWSGGLDV